MDQGKKKIQKVRAAAVVCFVICFLVFLSICVLQTQYRGEVSPARMFWGVMTIIAAVGIAQVEIMLAVLYPADFRGAFSTAKALFGKEKAIATKTKKA